MRDSEGQNCMRTFSVTQSPHIAQVWPGDLCNLPLEKKLEIEMVSSTNFADYLPLNCEKAPKRPSGNVRYESVAI